MVRSGTPNANTVYGIIFVVVSTNLIVMVFCSRADLSDSTDLLQKLSVMKVSVDIDFIYIDVEAILCTLWVTVPFLPAYTIIAMVLYKIGRSLKDATKKMSTRTKEAHTEIIKGLVLQSCLPAIDVVAITVYALSLVYGWASDVVGYSVLMCAKFVCSLHPFISLYFIRHYRVTIWNFMRTGKATTPINSHISQTDVARKNKSVVKKASNH
ncbi:hypothetical protein PRIPAC_80744 [Pristionchus pacificus]|uniref:G protein-coupled receptor n=1 Tax=Pristionchus pacificus TaxID=54126 RepID=A0A2A6C2R5_PRIPA|nr:hypothetical protein PRIPAC_80744 [Pristionchus pacificus]|eukprot:PDM72399.1 G protein-coupled receptor [Pristionchus pacificus]